MDTFVAYQAYYFFFNVESDVDEFVLNQISNSNKAKVYSDKVFGMDSVYCLKYWVAAM